MKLPTEPLDYHLYLAGRTVLPSGEGAIPPLGKKEYFFIQFTKALTLEERKNIQHQHDLSLKRYIPNFAFLEQLDNEQWLKLKQESLYRAIERYKPEYKISPALETQSSSIGSHPEGVLLRVVFFFETDEPALNRIKSVIISLRNTFETEEPDADEIKQLDNRGIGGNLYLVFRSSSIDWLPKLAEEEEVQWIEEVHKTNADCFRALFAANKAKDGCRSMKNLVAGTIQSGTPGVTPIWKSDLNGLNQIIGILDDFGPDLTHCMFRDDAGTAVGASHRKVVGFRNPSKTCDEHATAVAGIIAGDQASLLGKGENRGIAWAAKLSTDDLKNFNENHETVLDIFTRQKNDGATIHSNSWHQDETFYNATASDVDNFVHHNEENFVCGSNANSSSNERLGPPGSAKNALCVSAGDSHPNHRQHMDGTDGPTSDKRLKPDICAPGCGINSPLKKSKCLCKDFGCATSWAAPVMSGAATLVRQYYLEGFYPKGTREQANAHSPSAALIKATLLNSTVPMEDVKNYPNARTGWGLIQLNNTLFLAGAKRRLFMADVRNADGLSKEQSHLHSIEVKDKSEPLKITLVWTDPAAQVNAGKALVNDLDLVVTSPGGTTYRGNANFSEGFSQPQPNPVAADPNNVEMVIVAVPDPGTWMVTVEGREVNVGLQGYALVASFS